MAISTALWKTINEERNRMKSALLLQSNDPELVNRGYHVALKLIPNVVRQMTVDQLTFFEANPAEIAKAATLALHIRAGADNRVEITKPKIVIPNLRNTGRTLADWLKAREILHRSLTGETVVLTDLFAFTGKELASTSLMPAFRPAGATNRMSIEWKMKMGEGVPYEEADIMRYKNSGGPKEPELYLLNRSPRPDTDTLGEHAKSPDDLVQVKGKLWVGLYGWSDADTLYAAITGKNLDTETWCWFPEDRLPGGKVASGDWDGGQAGFCWGYRGYCDPHGGARSAKKVSLRP
ncbi:MAG: hypothetical protein Greene041679_154 [Parcubacteria group bacterium Greene0416_79]|nr:MAG: hypothetical protein Greene041679_154 [Parcubacteria group bacterium Greene0416_79]